MFSSKSLTNLTDKLPRRQRPSRQGMRLRLFDLEDRTVPTIFVTSLADTGISSTGTLRWAIDQANNYSPGHDLINIGVPGTIALNYSLGALPPITEGVDIFGMGSAATTIDAGLNYRVFDINIPSGDNVVNITNMTISQGSAASNGGAIWNRNGELKIVNSRLTSNLANDGGAIYNGPAATKLFIQGGSIDHNTASGSGGGVLSESSQPVLFSVCTLDSNRATIAGGAVLNGASGLLQIAGSTITNNMAWTGAGTFHTGHGGGVSNEVNGSVSISATRIEGNLAGDFGGGVNNQAGGTVTLSKCSLLYNNTGSHGNYDVTGGGGVANFGASGTLNIDYCAIAENHGGRSGGGVLSFGPLLLQNSSIWHNTGRDGGGVAIYGSVNSQEIVQCTISNNQATEGGGIYLDDGAYLSVYNSTIVCNHLVWDHGWGDGGGIYSAEVQNPTTVHLKLLSTIVEDITNYHQSKIQANYCFIGAGINYLNLTNSSNNHTGTINLTQVPYTMTSVPGVDNITQSLGLPIPELYSADPPTWYPVYEGGMTEDSSHPLVTDQRGGSFARHVGSVDIGAYEHDTNPQGVHIRYTPRLILDNGSVASLDVSVMKGSTTATLSLATADDNDLVVRGPNGFTTSAKFLTSFKGVDPDETVLRYQFTAPGGQFDPSDNGLYYGLLQPSQLFTTDSVALAPTSVQSILVNIATSILVTNTNDNGAGSLREAVLTANQLETSIASITFDPAVFASSQTISLTGDGISVRNGMYLVGPGSNLLSVISSPDGFGNPHGRVFDIGGFQGMHVSISGLKMSGAAASANGGTIRIVGADVDVADAVLLGVGTGKHAAKGGAISVEPESTHPDRGSLVLTNSTISGFSASQTGGAIILTGSGKLTLSNSSVSGNTAGISGGGIATGAPSASVTLTESTVAGNMTNGSGGGLYFQAAGTLIVTRSTISGNVCDSGYMGGGVYMRDNSNLTLINSTVSGNTCGPRAGGIGLRNFSGVATFRNSTIANNKLVTPGGIGGGIGLSGGGTLYFDSTVVAGNAADIGPDWSHDGFNLNVTGSNNLIGIADTLNVTLNGSNNLTGTLSSPLNAKLGPLANNGGSTQTHAILPGSPLINAGSNPAALTTDQRGSGFLRTNSGTIDIGAYESKLPPTVTSVTFGDGSTHRSLIKQLVVNFSEPVTFAGSVASAFTLHRSGTGGTIGDVTLTATPATGPTGSVTLTFSGSLTEFGSLVDGYYDFIASAAQISGANGLLDGNVDGIAGGSYSIVGNSANKFFRLFGDHNADATVSQVDFNAFRLAFLGGPNAEFDFDIDGQVSQSDFNAFRLRFLGTP